MPYDWIPLSDDEMIAAVPPDHDLAPNGPYPLSRCQEETVIMPALGKDDDVLHLLKKIISSLVSVIRRWRMELLFRWLKKDSASVL
mgnify:FL=1